MSGHGDFACNGQQIVKFRDALRFVTGTCAGGLMGWPGMLWTLIFRMLPTLPDNQLCSGRTVVTGLYNQYCTRPPSLCTTLHA